MFLKRALRASLTAATLLLIPVGSATAETCDPHGAQLDRARTLMALGKYDEALAIVVPIATSDPADFRAAYLKSYIVVSKADAADRVHWTKESAGQFQTGIAGLEALSGRLTTLDRACAKRKNFYSLLNTIAAALLNRGRAKEALPYLLQAHQHADMLTPASRLKMLDNLGLAYLALGDYPNAVKTYAEGKTAGSRIADYQIQTARAFQSTAVKR